jgi:hypothetical protein
MQDLIVRNRAGGTVVHSFNPLDPSQRRVFTASQGATLETLKPVTTLPTVCVVNGEAILAQDWWQVELLEGDVAVYTMLPQGGGGGGSIQAVLGIVLIIVGVVVPGAQNLIWAGAAVLLSGLMPVPEMRAIAAPLGSSEAPSPTYNIQLSGNQARLGQAIPVVYGRHLIMPDFAGNPYTEFNNETDDQIYYALMCVGVMDKFTIESITIDDTVLDHFVEVTTQWIGPQFSDTLTLVDPGVVNAPEIAGQDMLLGTVVGPFAACGPGMQAHKLSIDVVMPKGLYFATDTGTLDPKTAEYMFEARRINDAGAAGGAWILLGVETITLAQNSAVRRTYNYTVPPARYEVRGQRIDVRDDNARAGHDVQWAGLRAYLNIATPLEPSANFLALKIRATAQLSGLSQRRIAVIVRRWLPKWDIVTGWSAPIETRSIAWVLADILRNPYYGPAVPDSRIDLKTLYELDQVWEARGDHFNGVFDRRITVWQALTIVARCGRARPVMRGSVFTFVRDDLQTLPVALFNSRNIQRGSFKADYTVVMEDTPDGLEVEFFNETIWATDYVTMPIPGVDAPVSPARISLQGITELRQVQRECAYMVADMAYRPARFSFETELEGHLPAMGDLVAVSPELASWGYNGELVSWDGATAVCSETLEWSVGTTYALLTDSMGDVHGPFRVVQGAYPNSMTFVDAPTMTPYVGTERERTRYTMGPVSSYTKYCKVLKLEPSADNTVKMVVVVEDERVHRADEPYLSGSGGGGGTSGDRIFRVGPETVISYSSASDEDRALYGFLSDDDLTIGGDPGYGLDAG